MVKIKYEVLESLTPENPTYSILTPTFKRYFGNLKKGFQFYASDIIEMHKEILYVQYKTRQNIATALSSYIKQGLKAKALRIIELGHIPDEFIELESVQYWRSQLRHYKLKNIKSSNPTTRTTYTLHLWKFNQWLIERQFKISKISRISESTFEQKTEHVQFKSVEELLSLASTPFQSKADIVKVVKNYLLDPTQHKESKASYVKSIKSAILSYFEKNEQKLVFTFTPENHYDDETAEQELTLSDLMEILTTGRPTMIDKAVVLCKFQRGLDISTFADRFNFEAWGQIVKWFETENYDSWDLKKCPVPIELTRIKTSYKHVGFLDVDAIYYLQKYLKIRETKVGRKMVSGDPIFLNSKNEAISVNWISDHFFKIAKNSGILKKIDKRQFNFDSHELRDLLKSTLIAYGCRPDIADHAIGHMPKDSYEKQPKLYPKLTREEYAKASRQINIFQKFSEIITNDENSDVKEMQPLKII